MPIIKSINPYTLELNAEFKTISLDETIKKIEIAHDAYLSWKETTINYKKDLFLKLADNLEAEIDECARLETIEMWMLYSSSKAWLQKTANLIRWFANNFEEILKEKEYELRKEANVKADFYPSKGDEYTVNLKISEKESPLLEINLNVVSRDQAVYICDHWEKKHSDVYSMLIEKLLFDEPDK